jgi:hypothetical protein
MMKKLSIYILFALTMLSCVGAKQNKMNDLAIYLDYLVGDFDNQAQIDAEIKAGQQIHPHAKHLTRIITHRIKGIPSGFKSVFVLEESYYTYPNQETIIKPYIFRFELNNENRIVLNSMVVPERIDKKILRNDNASWTLNFDELKNSPSFKPATYTKTERGFYIYAPNDLPGGVKFTLEETIGNGFLEVMELAEKEGKRLTPYAIPLMYKRMKI